MSSIDATISPPLYSLVDLLNDKVEGRYYRESLFKSSPPDYESNFFEIEKILGQKKVGGKTFFLVKFLYYSSKFNEFIPEENFVTSSD